MLFHSKDRIAQPRKVLLLGVELSVVRSLGRKGVEVHTAWTPPSYHSVASRYITCHHSLTPYAETGEEWKIDLKRLLEKEAFDLVIPTNDPCIIPVQLHRKELENCARFYLLDDEVFQITSSKLRSTELARSLGLPTPRSFMIHHSSDLCHALQSLDFPIVMKPIRSFNSSNLSERSEVRKAYTKDDAMRFFTEMKTEEGVLVQETFIGHGMGVEVLAHEGEILTAFQHLRVHEPPHGGSSSYRRGVPLDPHLFKATQQLMKALRYTGVGMVEYKYNLKTNEWRFIEINGRFWGSLPLAVASGADFPWFLFQMLLEGKREFPRQFRTGLYCRNLQKDLEWIRYNFRADASDPTLLRVPGWQALVELGNLLTLKEKSDTFAMDDLKPGWLDLFSYLDGKQKGLLRKVQAGFRQRLNLQAFHR